MSTKIVEASRVVNWASVNILLTTRDLCCNYLGTPRDNEPCFPCFVPDIHRQILFVRSCFNLLLRSPRNFHWTCETQCPLTLCIIKGADSRTWMFSCSLRNAVSDGLRNDVLSYCMRWCHTLRLSLRKLDGSAAARWSREFPRGCGTRSPIQMVHIAASAIDH